MKRVLRKVRCDLAKGKLISVPKYVPLVLSTIGLMYAESVNAL
jgi:hypothetical protein